MNDGCIDDTRVRSAIIANADETVEMNYFVTRIQLAVIEGGVYDYPFSTRSYKCSAEERSYMLETIACAFETWKASIPFDFSPSVAPDMASSIVFQLLVVLHSNSLACTTVLKSVKCLERPLDGLYTGLPN